MTRRNGGGASAVDPYAAYDRDLVNHASLASADDTSVKTRRAQAGPLDGQSTGVFIVAGQSNAVNDHTSGYSIVNPTKLDNLNPLDGAVYAMSEPLLGTQTVAEPTTRGNLFINVADQLAQNGKYQRIVMIPVAIGATTVQDWNSRFWVNIPVAYKRAAALGLQVNAVLWQQGESNAGTVSITYQSEFLSMLGKVQAAGVNVPWLLAKSSYITGASSATVRAAIDALVTNNPTVLKAGPDTDTLGNAFRYDTTHFNMNGRTQGGILWANAIAAALP